MKYLSLAVAGAGLLGAVAVGVILVRVVEGVQELGERLDDVESKVAKPASPRTVYNSDGTPYVDTSKIVEQNAMQNVKRFVREEDVSQ